ncbi:MAG: hypothetical protein P4L43_15550 [Syntrophobacteraceae bacterium]|nr:hypothetical protein [Syntrophobacteraceae bacterium]
MRSFLGLFTAAFLACAIFGCGSAAHEPKDFRGLKWGEKTSAVSGLHQVAGSGDLALYEKSGEVLKMGDIELDRVIYAFYKDSFYMGMAYFSSEGFMKMEAVLTEKLGKPSEVDNNPDNLIWDSDNVSVLLTPAGPGQTRLVYMYKPTQLKVELKK